MTALDLSPRFSSSSLDDRSFFKPPPPRVEESDVEESSIDSSNDALLEILGLASLEGFAEEEEVEESEFGRDVNSGLPVLSDEDIVEIAQQHRLRRSYDTESVCVFPPECSIPAEYMRRLTEQLVWGGDKVQADKTYETVQVYKQGELHSKKSLTRLEHFVDAHEDWSELCHNYLRRLVSKALGIPMVLYKEKLNLKPPGSSGFAPHLDTPSLRIALGEEGPQEFCTVMVAIDDMTVGNGCLRFNKGPWSEDHCVSTIAPNADGNPDAGGRAGAIPQKLADSLDFEPLVCKGGSIAVFNGWAPHRSAANGSPFPRRAVFLTYNLSKEGDFHRRYYQMMDEKRQKWRESVGLAERQQREEDEHLEMQALSTVPNN